MNDLVDNADHMLDKLDSLMKRQDEISKEIAEMREVVSSMKRAGLVPPESIWLNISPLKVEDLPYSPSIEEDIKSIPGIEVNRIGNQQKRSFEDDTRQVPVKASIENFIGENLVSKIGIVITVIGVAIGAKYAIDHQLISPLARILSGYLFSFVMLLIALRLKKNYENFSAVLLSGSMAIMYFITYAAFGFYNLIPQAAAFALMVLFTAFTVAAAIRYDRQIIAHIGLVGAYAVPLVLSTGTENTVVFFAYTAIINTGILIISFKKYWKPLYYTSFIITWLLYLLWFIPKYRPTENFDVASGFLIIFYLTFYLMFLAFKLIRKEKFDFYDVLLLLANSFIFYGIGYKILSGQSASEEYAGLFTFFNALLHSLISLLIRKRKLADRNLFYLVSGLAFIFIAISIPVQFKGNWISLLWSGEALLLFWIGRTKGVKFYEIFSYLFIYLAFVSFIQDLSPYSSVSQIEENTSVILIFLNVRFLTGLMSVAAYGLITFIYFKPGSVSPIVNNQDLKNLVSWSVAGIFLISLFFLIKTELSSYYERLYYASGIDVNSKESIYPFKVYNIEIERFKTVVLLNYSMLYFSILTLFNIYILRERTLGLITMAANTAMLTIFLVVGLYTFSVLRDIYINQPLVQYYHRGVINVGVRYISFCFVALLISATGILADREFMKPLPFKLKTAFDILLYTSLLCG